MNNVDIIIKALPEQPGVYKFLNSENKIIYVGKAKNLKKRVSSYFSKNHDSIRVNILVKKISNIEYIVVDRETEALLLENTLIKKYQPSYNIRLKDDKSYPHICIKKEHFPRIFLTRKLEKDGSEYFGPYSNVKQAKILLEIIKEIYKLRTCYYDLSKDKIESKKYKVCLEYHIKNCFGACEGLQTEDNYMEAVTGAKNIIKGNFKESLDYLNIQMNKLAEELKFEQAQQIKEKIEILQNYQLKSTVVNKSIHNVDVFSIVSDSEYCYVNYLKILNGAIINSYTIEIKKCLDETDKEIIQIVIPEIRNIFNSDSKEIYLPFDIDYQLDNAKIIVPLIGEKKSIVEFSQKNANYFRLESLKKTKILDPEKHSNRIIKQMQKDLNLDTLPIYIECFDNSNMQGTNPVASCVVFKNGKPSKKDYKHFNIKNVEGPNDFASMEEIIFRRYKRLLDENEELPQLIVVDGGKGQLSSALKSLEVLGLKNKISIIGIAKRLEEIYFPNDSIPLHLDKRSETLKIIQNLRNEAHRFAITHHRKKREKNLINTGLLDIPGIGNITAGMLLRKFKSIERIKLLSLDDLENVLDKKRAQIVYKYYKIND